MADMVIDFFKRGFYTADDMKLFVEVQWITKEQYKETTGIDYTTPLPLSDDHEPVQSEAPASEATSEAPVEAPQSDAPVADTPASGTD